jgi:glycosyltransferase involved in cell wall biosynthesis
MAPPSGPSDGEPVELSLVVPMYNELAVLDAFFARVIPIVEAVTPRYEVIGVDDGSTDGTLPRLCAMHLANRRIKLVALSRNFGKEAALSAGLDFARGAAVIPIDADLQDPPELIAELVAAWRQGYQVVLARRIDRDGDSVAKRLSARLFYRVINRLSEVPIPEDVGDFRLLDRRVVEALRRMPERMRFMKGLFAWAGFRQTTVEYHRPVRAAGRSKWSYWRLWNLALGGVTSFSTAPLRVWTYVGLTTALSGLIYLGYTLARTLLHGVDVPGYASLICILLVASGLNMIGLGILGEYLGRVFMEVKQRPLYLVAETIGFGADARERMPARPSAAAAGTRPASPA